MRGGSESRRVGVRKARRRQAQSIGGFGVELLRRAWCLASWSGCLGPENFGFGFAWSMVTPAVKRSPRSPSGIVVDAINYTATICCVTVRVSA